MPLTAAAIRNAEATKKPFKLSDGGGLFLLVAPNGGKYGRMVVRSAPTTAHARRSLIPSVV